MWDAQLAPPARFRAACGVGLAQALVRVVAAGIGPAGHRIRAQLCGWWTGKNVCGWVLGCASACVCLWVRACVFVACAFVFVCARLRLCMRPRAGSSACAGACACAGLCVHVGSCMLVYTGCGVSVCAHLVCCVLCVCCTVVHEPLPTRHSCALGIRDKGGPANKRGYPTQTHAQTHIGRQFVTYSVS